MGDREVSDANAKADVDSGEYNRHYQLLPGDVILDIGAHVGYYSEYAAEKVGKDGLVIAVEPEPENFKLLKRRAQNFTWVNVHNLAAWNEWGLKMLWKIPGHSGGHSLFKTPSHTEVIPIVTAPASAFIPHRHHIRFIKLDAEGAEFVILKDLMPKLKAPVDITFETHSVELFNQCLELLCANGFTLLEREPIVGICHAWIL